MQKSPFLLQPIGLVHSCFTEKFGIPRQPGLAPHATGEIIIHHEFARIEMFRQLDRFSHIWVSFLFHQAIDEGWKTTVRPPALGGQKRAGIFATRSPHRPNFLGLSCVKLDRISHTNNKLSLHVSGLDILNKSPVVDVKPYISYSDQIHDATGGYPSLSTTNTLTFSPQAIQFCLHYKKKTGRKLKELLTELLSQDLRPASQRGKKKEFGISLWDTNTVFHYTTENEIFIAKCTFHKE